MLLLENSWTTRQTEPRWSLCGWSTLATRRPCTIYIRQGICGIAPCKGFQVGKLAKPKQMTSFSIGPPIFHLEYFGPELAGTTIYQMCVKRMRSTDIVGSCQDLGCTLCITTGHKIGEFASFQSGTGPAQEHSGELLRRRHQFHVLVQFDHSITGKIQQWWSRRELTCVVLGWTLWQFSVWNDGLGTKSSLEGDAACERAAGNPSGKNYQPEISISIHVGRLEAPNNQTKQNKTKQTY